MRYLLLFICSLAIGTGQAQDFDHNYHPIRTSKVPVPVLKNVFADQEKLAGAQNIEGASAKKDFVKFYKENAKTFAELDTLRTLMYTDTLAGFVKNTIQKITQANPELAQRKFVTFTLRDEDVNAANYGPELMTFNLGLLAHVDTYEEFVFVMCHELSHEYLEHSFYTIKEYVKLMHDTDFRKKVRQLKRQEYNSVKQAELLIARTLAGITRNSRAQELEADSMGLVFYTRLGLDKTQSVHLMEMLDSAEIPYAHHHIDFKNYFDPNQSFFDDTWLMIDSSHNWIPDSAVWMIPDSLKTHPDCKLRIGKLKEYGCTVAGALVNQDEFLSMRTLARFELLEEYLSNEDYANSLFYAMQLQQQFPHNLYVKNVALNSLIEMSNALKEHRFSEVVDHPNYFYYPQFNRLLYMLHNMNSSSLRKMAIAYFNTHLENEHLEGDAFTGYNAILMKSWDTAKESQAGLIEVYKKNFTDKFYLKKLEEKFKTKKK